MTRLTLTFFGLIICNSLFAQKFTPITISSGGDLLSNADVKMTFTIGEPVSGNISNNSAKFTQGFQQNWTILSTGFSDVLNNNSLMLYPNPTSDIIHIKFEKGISENAIIEMIDLNGKRKLRQMMESNVLENQINISNCPENLYIINISTQSGKLLGSYKIQKIK